MNLRQHLSDTVALLDKFPQIKTETMGKPIITALGTFRKKFDALVEELEEEQGADELKRQLVKMEQTEAHTHIRRLKEPEFLLLCKILSIKPKASPKTAKKKLTAREAGELKLFKAIDDIRKQTY
jgi:hypothetical protein